MDEFVSYVSLDNVVATESDEFNVRDSIGLTDTTDVAQSDDVDDSEPATVCAPPTLSMTLQAIDVIRKFLIANGCNNYDDVYQMQNKVIELVQKTAKQSYILDYFKKH